MEKNKFATIATKFSKNLDEIKEEAYERLNELDKGYSEDSSVSEPYNPMLIKK